MARKKPSQTGVTSGEVKKARLLADQAAALAEYAAKALVAAGQLRVKSRPVDGLLLREADREALSVLPAVPAKVRKKLARGGCGPDRGGGRRPHDGCC